MGIMDELKKLARPYTEDEDDFDDFDLEERPRASRASTAPRTAPRASTTYDEVLEETTMPTRPVSTPPARRGGMDSKVVNISAQTQMQVIIEKPDRYDNVNEIAEHIRSKHAVVLNLEATNKDVARRLVDFLSGCAFALDCHIKKIAISTYIITPYHVDIVGDLLDELENNGMYL